MDINYGPAETKGREFKGEDYMWVLVMGDGKATYCKVDKINYERAIKREPFDIWHPLGATPQGLVYMSASAKTLEPWMMTTITSIAIVHPTEAAHMDEMVKNLVSTITIATEVQMPKAWSGGPKGIIRD